MNFYPWNFGSEFFSLPSISADRGWVLQSTDFYWLISKLLALPVFLACVLHVHSVTAVLIEPHNGINIPAGHVANTCLLVMLDDPVPSEIFLAGGESPLAERVPCVWVLGLLILKPFIAKGIWIIFLTGFIFQTHIQIEHLFQAISNMEWNLLLICL